MPSVVAGRAALAPARMIAVYSGGLPIRQKRQLPKARHGAGARPVHCEFFKYLINSLVSDFVTQLAPQPFDQPASQLFTNSQNTNQ